MHTPTLRAPVAAETVIWILTTSPKPPHFLTIQEEEEWAQCHMHYDSSLFTIKVTELVFLYIANPTAHRAVFSQKHKNGVQSVEYYC